MNDLLLWMSARQAGSISSFRSIVGELRPPNAGRGNASHRAVAWTLSKLGHAEFEAAAGETAWRVAPPVLAAATGLNAEPLSVLCGARSEPLLAALAAVGGPRLQRHSLNDGPDLFELRAENPDVLTRMANDAGIPIQWNAPLAVLAACPPLASVSLKERPLPIGAGWTISRFSKSGLAWVPCTTAEARAGKTNLLRFRSQYGTHYVLSAEERYFSCDPAMGKYRVLTRRHRPLAYDATTRELAIAISCRPPELVERALVISSGRLPEVRTGKLVYTRIALATAVAAAAILGQRLH